MRGAPFSAHAHKAKKDAEGEMKVVFVNVKGKSHEVNYNNNTTFNDIFEAVKDKVALAKDEEVFFILNGHIVDKDKTLIDACKKLNSDPERTNLHLNLITKSRKSEQQPLSSSASTASAPSPSTAMAAKEKDGASQSKQVSPEKTKEKEPAATSASTAAVAVDAPQAAAVALTARSNAVPGSSPYPVELSNLKDALTQISKHVDEYHAYLKKKFTTPELTKLDRELKLLDDMKTDANRERNTLLKKEYEKKIDPSLRLRIQKYIIVNALKEALAKGNINNISLDQAVEKINLLSQILSDPNSQAYSAVPHFSRTAQEDTKAAQGFKALHGVGIGVLTKLLQRHEEGTKSTVQRFLSRPSEGGKFVEKIEPLFKVAENCINHIKKTASQVMKKG